MARRAGPLLAAALVALFATTSQVDAAGATRATATALQSDLNVLGAVSLSVAPTGTVLLPPTGGDMTQSVASANVPPAGAPALSVSGLVAHAHGSDDATVTEADASAATVTAAGLGLSLQTLSATCQADPSGLHASATLVGSVAGSPLASPIAANTTIPLPGVGSVTLNEQHFTAHTVDVVALDVGGSGLAAGHLVVGHAFCDPSAAVPNPPASVPETSHAVWLLAGAIGVFAAAMWRRRVPGRPVREHPADRAR
jgi:hypothetical protein